MRVNRYKYYLLSDLTTEIMRLALTANCSINTRGTSLAAAITTIPSKGAHRLRPIQPSALIKLILCTLSLGKLNLTLDCGASIRLY